MKKIALASNPRETTQKILKTLPNKRLRDVIERRYGLRSGKEETLDAIGKNYGVTRERVRQIEADALKRLNRQGALESATQSLLAIARHLDDHGGVAEEKKLLHSIGDNRLHPHVNFVLALADGLARKKEDSSYYHRWYTRREALEFAESVLEKTVSELAVTRKPISGEELNSILKQNAKSILGSQANQDVLDSYLGISKKIKQNTYGEYGLAEWPEISPSGIRDKAYAALLKGGSPMHFRAVAVAIDKAGWSSKKAHPQTVHNELIKDNRFVLVGRGLYALKEWGYEAGTVSDIIQSVLMESKKPLSKMEVMKRVMKKRVVKENTISLNLQNRKRFKKSEDGYTLV